MSGDSMAEFVSAITATSGGLTSANLWGEAANAATLIAAIAIFAFGYRIVKRVVSGASRGKVKM